MSAYCWNSQTTADTVEVSFEFIARTQGVPLGEVRLRPILQPPTVRDFRDFMLYEGHASASGPWQLSDAWYRLQIFYFSNPLCIFGPEDTIPYSSLWSS